MPFDRQVTRSALRCGEERAIASERLMPQLGLVYREQFPQVKNELSRLSV